MNQGTAPCVKVPAPKAFRHGKRFTVTNFSDVCSALACNPSDVADYIATKLDVTYNMDGPQLILKGLVLTTSFTSALLSYVNTFVVVTNVSSRNDP